MVTIPQNRPTRFEFPTVSVGEKWNEFFAHKSPVKAGRQAGST